MRPSLSIITAVVLLQSCGSFENTKTTGFASQTNSGLGGVSATPTPRPTPGPTATPAPAPVSTPTPRPGATASPTPRPTAAPVPTAPPTATPAPTATPMPTPKVGFTPTPAPAAMPPSDKLGATIGSFTRLDPRTTMVQLSGAAEVEGVRVSKFSWTQSAGPQPVFINYAEQQIIRVFGLTKAGTYDLKLDVTLEDGSMKKGYVRAIVNDASTVKMYTSSGVRLDLYKNGQLFSTGQLAKGDVVTPRAFYSKSDGMGGKIDYEVDLNTVGWRPDEVLLDTSCVNGDQVSVNRSGNVQSPKAFQYVPAGRASQSIATLYRGAVDTTYDPGELVVHGLDQKGCRVYVEVSGALGSDAKAIDGTPLGIAGFVNFSYGMIISNP